MPPRPTDRTWASWLSLYRKQSEKRGLAPGTVASYTRALEQFASYCEHQRGRQPHLLGREDLLAFMKWLARSAARSGLRRGRRLAAATIQVHLGAVRGFCHWLVSRGALLGDPCVDLPELSVTRAPPRILSLPEVLRVLAAPAASPRAVLRLRDRAILELLYASGLRVGQLVSLDLTDVDLSEHDVRVRRARGGPRRRVPIGDQAAQALRAYLDLARERMLRTGRRGATSALFLSLSGRRLSRREVGWVVSFRASQAGVTGRVTPQTLRHTAAAHLVRLGASLRHLQEFLGHAALPTTAYDAPLAVEDLKKAHRRFHPRQRMKV